MVIFSCNIFQSDGTVIKVQEQVPVLKFKILSSRTGTGTVIETVIVPELEPEQ